MALQSKPPLRRGWLLVLLPAGFGFGVVAGFMQEQRLMIGSVPIPWAAVLLLAALVVTIRALSLNMESRSAGGLFYFGWVVATVLLALPNPSGDVVFTADLSSFAYLLGGGVLGAAVAAWPLMLTHEGAGQQASLDG